MTKEELVKHLESTRMMLWAGVGAVGIAFGKEGGAFRGLKLTLPIPNVSDRTRDLSEIADKPIMQRELVENLTGAFLRAGITLTYETLLSYVAATKQTAAFNFQQPWKPILTLLRHAASHANGVVGRLSTWPDKLEKAGIMSFKWRHRTFDESCVGADIQFSLGECDLLLADVIEFAKRDLK